MKIQEIYFTNKSTKKGSKCICPSCGSSFVKNNNQQAFCSKNGTKCKDKYWNTVDPKKRNNTTRISPASRIWLENKSKYRENSFNPDDYEHPFSSESLGQWND